MECTQLSLFGRTYQEPFPATTEKTSGRFWKNLPALDNQTLPFLDLRGGRWSKAGAIAGNGWSLAWRQLDSQYFGVAQRRKRIALVADFGGQRAGEILFERTSMSRHPDPCIPAWKEVAGLTTNCSAGNDRVVAEGGRNAAYTLKIRSGCAGGGKGALIQENKSATLSCNNDQTLFEPCGWDGGQISPTLTKQNAGGNQRMPDKDNFTCVLQPFGICSKDSNAMKSDNPHSGIYEAETARTLDGNGGNPSCNQGGIAVVAFTQNQRDEVRDLGDRSAVVCANAGTKQQTFVLQGSMIGREDKNGPQGDGINEDVSFTLNTVDRHAVYAMTTGSFTQVSKEKAPTVLARDYKDPTAVCYGIGRDTFNQGQNAKFAPTFEKELQPTLVAKGPGAIQSGYTVRRLTPTECARLQGFPDNWCANLGTEKPSDEEMYFWHKVFKTYSEVTGCKVKSDKQVAKWLKNPYSDSAEYKMWGNGVALPCVWFVLCGIVWYAQSGGDNAPI